MHRVCVYRESPHIYKEERRSPLTCGFKGRRLNFPTVLECINSENNVQMFPESHFILQLKINFLLSNEQDAMKDSNDAFKDRRV